MKLQKVTLQGFKSFADKTEFDFTHNLTAVVGPNGSGKSNIADAIRWVLGEQSMKLLRAKSQSDLIFGGSVERSRLGMAQVDMYLDNGDHQFPVDYEEVVITRKLFRSGESEYLLNNTPVRLQDIVIMLAQANFGQKSYAVIGQGMITDFLNSTPQERKIFFDEATGVREFQIKRDQAINKLIRSEENLIQGEQVLNEIEPHLKSLKRQVERLEKREKIEQQLHTLQVEYYGSLWASLQEEANQLHRSFAIKEEECIQAEKELSALQQASDVIAQESSRTERYEALQQEYTELLEQKNSLIKEQAVLKGKLEIEHQKQGELSLVWLQRKEDEIAQDKQKYENRLQQLEQQKKRQMNELERAQQQLDALQKEIVVEEQQYSALQQQIEKEMHTMTIPEIQQELRGIFDEQEAFVRELMKTESLEQFRTLQTYGKKILKTFAHFMDRFTTTESHAVDILQVELQRRQDSLTQLVAERTQIQQQMNTLQVEFATTEKEMELHHSQLKRLQEEGVAIEKERTQTQKESNTDPESHIAAVQAELHGYEKHIVALDATVEQVRERIDRFNKEEENKKTELVNLQSNMRAIQRQVTNVRQEANTIEIHIARVETRQEDIRTTIVKEVIEELQATIFAYTQVDTKNHAIQEKQMLTLKKQLEAIGTIDDATVQEYHETQERFDFLNNQITDITHTIESLEKVIDDLDETIRTQFGRNFKKINEGFEQYFKILFDGGHAKLTLMTETESAPQDVEGENIHTSTDTAADEISEGEVKVRELIGKKKKKQKTISGIDVAASPPRKKVTHIQSLSGGEKSLVAIALLCSIIANNPSPFVVLDEVEAALDEENSEKLAAILQQLSKKTQLIVVTHNRVTMRAADVLYGVTVGLDGKSHILSVKLEEAEELVEVDQ